MKMASQQDAVHEATREAEFKQMIPLQGSKKEAASIMDPTIGHLGIALIIQQRLWHLETGYG